ncbi:serine hydrolase domain-containing protein [Rufibacter latericius]|uniref:Class A beta-lactamase-related serine hydrolase n=1 Tax=Rufibacter latericius TaxID=2487040 RepID=A0A3M9MVB0_9BACT|nr:serine hydrolase domain-containing protein [Rufibacter latericius]RNI28698.1 class A beta-lactamase-related serine hydrolase [Rufibacter latericius]
MSVKPTFLAFCCYFWFSLFTQAQTITRLDKSTITAKALHAKIQQLMQAAQVQGLAVAVFNQNKAVFQKTFGYKNAVTKEPLKPTTNIYGASLSKAVFAVLVMQLVEEGKLDLDKSLQSYLPKPIYEYAPLTKWQDHYQDLKQDTLYQKITARMCLAHTSGFPNWRWDLPDEKLRVLFKPGSQYGYSGEGMVYLQTVLEKMLGMPLEQMMKERIFGPMGMVNSSYTWQPRFEHDYSLGHRSNGTLYEKDKDNEARSASTLETNLQDYTLFMEAVLQNRLLKPATTKAMFSPQIRIRTKQQHGPLRFQETADNDGINLSYGLGWVLLKSPYGTGAFKEGHGDGFQHYSILFPETGTGILLMSNSDNAESIFKELLAFAIGDTYTPWYWENYLPYNQKKADK